jgi:MerR family redox-sensitive transcriptional activator SoxR
MAHDGLTIGKVAKLAGIPTSTMRYYERIGILPRPQRISGKRLYTREILPVLEVIHLAKEANFSLPEIKELLGGERGTPSERWQRLAAQKLREVNETINRAQEMKQLLEEGLSSDALHYELDECSLLSRPKIAS